MKINDKDGQDQTGDLRTRRAEAIEKFYSQIRALEETLVEEETPGRVWDALDHANGLYNYREQAEWSFTEEDLRQMETDFEKALACLKAQISRPSTKEDRLFEAQVEELESQITALFFRDYHEFNALAGEFGLHAHLLRYQPAKLKALRSHRRASVRARRASSVANEDRMIKRIRKIKSARDSLALCSTP